MRGSGPGLTAQTDDGADAEEDEDRGEAGEEARGGEDDGEECEHREEAEEDEDGEEGLQAEEGCASAGRPLVEYYPPVLSSPRPNQRSMVSHRIASHGIPGSLPVDPDQPRLTHRKHRPSPRPPSPSLPSRTHPLALDPPRARTHRPRRVGEHGLQAVLNVEQLGVCLSARGGAEERGGVQGVRGGGMGCRGRGGLGGLGHCQCDAVFAVLSRGIEARAGRRGGGLLTNACCSATRMIVEPVDRDPKYRSFAVQIKPYRLDIQDST